MLSMDQRIAEILLSYVKHEQFSPRANDLFAEIQDFTAADFGINSVDAQGMLKKIADEFGIEIPVEDAEKLDTLRALTDYIQARS